VRSHDAFRIGQLPLISRGERHHFFPRVNPGWTLRIAWKLRIMSPETDKQHQRESHLNDYQQVAARRRFGPSLNVRPPSRKDVRAMLQRI